MHALIEFADNNESALYLGKNPTDHLFVSYRVSRLNVTKAVKFNINYQCPLILSLMSENTQRFKVILKTWIVILWEGFFQKM